MNDLKAACILKQHLDSIAHTKDDAVKDAMSHAVRTLEEHAGKTPGKVVYQKDGNGDYSVLPDGVFDMSEALLLRVTKKDKMLYFYDTSSGLAIEFLNTSDPGFREKFLEPIKERMADANKIHVRMDVVPSGWNNARMLITYDPYIQWAFADIPPQDGVDNA